MRSERHPDWRDNVQIDGQFGGLSVRRVRAPQDHRAVERLRAARFRGDGAASDRDRFDDLCAHLLVLGQGAQTALGAARFRLLVDPEDVRHSYTGQFYDLTALGRAKLRLLEIGRICIGEGHERGADVPRALVAGLTRAAEATQAQMLVGCTSFPGADPERHRAALRYLRARHLGPRALRPRKRGGSTFDLHSARGTPQACDRSGIPALMRLYLTMGGWVSDHAVCDHDLDTLHVFTAVDIGAIPPARRRILQMLARG